MLINNRLMRHVLRLTVIPVCLIVCSINVKQNLAAIPDPNINVDTRTAIANESVGSASSANYKWNVSEREAPLLELTETRLRPGFDVSLSFPMGQYDLAVLKVLGFDELTNRYLLPTIAKDTKALHFVEFVVTPGTSTYTSNDGSSLQLIDKSGMKLLRLADGTKYIFVRYPDNEFRCASIQEPNGPVLYFLYSANGLMLHGITDSIGRSLTFSYANKGIDTITQTWMANSLGITKTWAVREADDSSSVPKFAHAIGINSEKFLPANALVRTYTAEMAASDKHLAAVFGGPEAVAGGNGYEPPGLASVYPLYRGDVLGDDGKTRRGHLSYAMHLYGSADGRGDSPIFIPAGFTSHSSEPSPTDASVTFFYPRLGNLTNVTLAVFHVADFQITNEGDRVRIGNIGGPGGSSPLYKHSHIEFYRGNTGLPLIEERTGLRIDPATVFGEN